MDNQRYIQALQKQNNMLLEQRDGLQSIITQLTSEERQDFNSILKDFALRVGADKALLLVTHSEKLLNPMLSDIDKSYSAVYQMTAKLPDIAFLLEKQPFAGPKSILKTASSDKKRQQEMDEYINKIESDIKSYLWLPLVVKGKMIGVIMLFESDNEEVFSIDYLQNITIATDTLALFIGYLISENKRNKMLMKSIKNEKEYTRLISNAIEDKIPYKYGHSRRVVEISLEIRRKCDMNENELHELEIAAMLHDVGKMNLSDNILIKPLLAGSVLTKSEKEEYEKHPENGVKALHNIPCDLQEIKDAIHQHHELYNGEGYPNRKKGNKITLNARIIGIACAFDDTLSKYRYNFSIGDRSKEFYELAFEEMEGDVSPKTGEPKYDPDIMKKFKTIIQEKVYFFRSDMDISLKRAYKSGKFEDALKECEAAIAYCKGNGQNLMVYMAAAKLLEKYDSEQSKDKVLHYYSEVIKKCPTFVEAYYRRGRVYQKYGFLGKAGMDYALATTICPTYVEAHLRLGQIRYRLGKYYNALDSFETVVSMEENNALAHMEIGNVYCCKAVKNDDNKVKYRHEAEMKYRHALHLITDIDVEERAKKLFDDKDIQLEIKNRLLHLNSIG